MKRKPIDEALLKTRRPEGLGSTRAAFLNFFKSMFGAGVLALPHAFTWAGLTGGIVVYGAAVYLCSYSMTLLIRCKRVVLAREPSAHIGTYPSLAGHSGGRRCYFFVAAAVVVLELAFCTGWVIVVADNVAIVTGVLNRAAWCWICAPVLCLLCSIRFMANLWPLSFLSLLIYLVGVMGSTYYFIASGKVESHFEHVVQIEWSTLPRFAGSAMYGLEAILMALPIEGTMAQPKQAPRVIVGGTLLYATISGIFGALCYAYGLGSCVTDGGAVITDCLPSGAITTTVRLSLASAILLSYPIILFPVSEIVQEMLFVESPTAYSCAIVRCAAVLLTCTVASLCSNFSIFSGIVGALLLPVVGFLLPALLHFGLVPWSTMSRNDQFHTVLMIVVAPSLMVLGVVGL